jgi:hypothetical protein
MTITLNLSPETERRLRARAAQSGQSLESYLQYLAESDLANGGPGLSFASHELSLAEFEQLLDTLSEGLASLPTLPVDFARAGVYSDHD